MDNPNIIQILKTGGVGILPTDTLYGLVGGALSKKTVERIYRLKERTPDKPFIILIPSVEDLKLFNIEISAETRQLLQKIWPNPVSVILPCKDEKFSYLHRGTKTLAFRISKDEKLQEILKQTGPLVAPSANPEGKPPAKNIQEAKRYFGGEVDFYSDGGELKTPASTLIKIEGKEITVLRQGDFQLGER